jgi:carbon-monoxide dehydrogenase medium subunit
VIPAPVEYVRPDSLEEALAELADPEAKAIAGGHSLVPMMKLRLARPSRLVDLAALGLSGTALDDGTIRIGALTTYGDLLSLGGEVALPEVLRECAAAVGDLQVRNAGTLGGALAHGDPASDLAAGAIATGTTLVLRSDGGTREVSAKEFFVGPFTTLLEQQEILVELRVPSEAPGDGSAYVAFDDPASGYPLAGAAVRIAADGGRSVGLTGVGAQPLLVEGDVDAALDSLGLDDYRRQLAVVAIERAEAAARGRAA